MPYKVEKKGDEYCVIKADSGETVKCHSSESDADAHMKALYANVEKSVPDEFERVELWTPIRFVKKAEDDPNVRIVYGCVSDTSIDMAKQRCDQEWLRKSLTSWFNDWGNIREMHKDVAVGTAVSLTEESPGTWFLTSKIVDEHAVRFLDEGIYKGYSIHAMWPKFRSDPTAPMGLIIGGDIVEVSLVDRPCNNNAKIAVVKYVLGSTEDAEKVAPVGAAAVPEVEKMRHDDCPEDCEECDDDGNCMDEEKAVKSVTPDLESIYAELVTIRKEITASWQNTANVIIEQLKSAEVAKIALGGTMPEENKNTTETTTTETTPVADVVVENTETQPFTAEQIADIVKSAVSAAMDEKMAGLADRLDAIENRASEEGPIMTAVTKMASKAGSKRIELQVKADDAFNRATRHMDPSIRSNAMLEYQRLRNEISSLEE